MHIRSMQAVPSLLFAAGLLAACSGGSSGGSAGTTPVQPQRTLGLMVLTVNAIGTPAMQSSAVFIGAGHGGGRTRSAADFSIEPLGLDVLQDSASTVDVGTRGNGGERYVSVVYKVRNAAFCAKPGTCTPYGVASDNLTLVAAATPSNLDGTAVTAIYREDGTTDATEQALATSLLPTDGMEATNPAGGVQPAPGQQSLQVFTESEIAGVTLDTGATGLFPYGYVVKNVNASTSRSLPGGPADNDFAGQVTFAFKFPLQNSATNDPFSVSFIFQVLDDANTRVTESEDEQNPAGDLAFNALATQLGSTDLAVLGGRAASSNISDPICTVRTAGTAGTPTAFLVDNGDNPTVGGAPYNLQFLARNTSINGGFCTIMDAGGFGDIVVSGSQSGRRTAAGPYTGSYAGGGGNQLSFTPDAAHPFFPGETVSFSYTLGLSSTGAVAASAPFVGSFLVSSSAAPGTFGTAANVSVGNNPSSLAVGDFEGNGTLDLAVANYSDDSVTILHNNGSGSYTTLSTLSVGPSAGGGASAIVAGDFNGDGILDLAVTDQTNNDIAIFIGTGGGGFNTAVTKGVGSSPEAIAVGDFNGDGAPDLVVANTGDGTISVLQNNGSGGFATIEAPIVGDGPLSVAVGDFNGDGILDLAVANSGDNDVAILFGLGSGTFNTAAATYTAGSGAFSSPDSIAVGDFNNDGIPDLAVGNSGDGTVALLTGLGGGVFPTVPVEYSVGSGSGSNPYYVAAGDFNGDGQLDLAVANNADGTVSVLLNNGSGFATAVDYNVGTTSPFPYSVYVGDFNGDGILDLAVANFGETDISILLGQH